MSRTAKYYASLTATTPFATVDPDGEYEVDLPESLPKDDFVKFVPSKFSDWNGVSSLTISYGGTASILSHVGFKCDAETGFVLLDTWEKRESYYTITVVFTDYYGATVAISFDGSDESDSDLTYSATVPVAELVNGEITLQPDFGSDDSDESDGLVVEASCEPVRTNSSPELKYYAVFRSSVDLCTVVYKWYQLSQMGVLENHEEIHEVEKGSSFPQTSSQPPTFDSSEGWNQAWSPAGPGSGSSVAESGAYEYVASIYQQVRLDWNMGDSPAVPFMTFTFGHYFPELPDFAPTREGYALKGIWLCDEGEPTIRCYNSSAAPCARLSVDIAETDSEDEPRYTLKAEWIPKSLVVDDIEGLRDVVGQIPSTFASSATARCEIPGKSESSVALTVERGFPSAFSTPIGSGGKVITRQMVNALGNMGSQIQFFEQCGGYHTFDPDFAKAVGGYPKGAVLQFFDEDKNALRTVKSLKDDNMDNFLEDRGFVGSLVYSHSDGQKVSWAYVDDNPIVNVKIDYTSYEDLSERLFVESGVPDLYEVPYDSYLQAFAVGSLDVNRLKHPQVEDVAVQIIKNAVLTRIYETNGMYQTEGQGRSYLDVYSTDSTSFSSILMGGFNPVTNTFISSKIETYHMEKVCPLSAFTCGVMLSAGDKIRVRNIIADHKSMSAIGMSISQVHSAFFTDDVLQRKYLFRFAALYRRGVAL